MGDVATVWGQVDTAIQQFLVIEVTIGMTFARAGMNALTTGECLRSRQLARRAYDTGSRWVERARFTAEGIKTYRRKLQELRFALNRLGDPVQDSYCEDVVLPRAS